MKQKNNVLILVIIVATLATGAFVYYKSDTSQSESTRSTQQTKTFLSKNLKFSINIPSNLLIEEKFTTITLKNDDVKITISRNGTNFEKLEESINDLHQKNKTLMFNKTSLNINGLTAIKGVLNNPSGSSSREFVYYIKIDNIIYVLSTKDESLYNDLDQIAQSFRYTP